MLFDLISDIFITTSVIGDALKPSNIIAESPQVKIGWDFDEGKPTLDVKGNEPWNIGKYLN